ncbi:hypothetical protein M5K25_018497 [Dendrobium thyrsiflorum]|uniref:ZF-HD dimerization-type domain-containing protein n=1 Tax=Dendrobium thyrsiflorum TaxID=117978 RepID=A0ABD0UIR8_DENTH
MEQKVQAEAQSKLSPLPNGAVKKSHHPHTTIIHRECLKNHAASLGGHALDGCCEFMPSPAAILADPTSLKCAACGCHRNFHRRVSFAATSAEEEEIEGEVEGEGRRRRSSSAGRQPLSSYFNSAPHTLLALSRDERPSPASVARKRFRTKFSAEQKGRMMELSERLGWKLQKRDEGLVDDYCREIGVGKGVFKVWMHNNKYQVFRALGRGDGRSNVAGVAGGGDGRTGEGNGISGEADGNVMNGSSSSS